MCECVLVLVCVCVYGGTEKEGVYVCEFVCGEWVTNKFHFKKYAIVFIKI